MNVWPCLLIGLIDYHTVEYFHFALEVFVFWRQTWNNANHKMPSEETYFCKSQTEGCKLKLATRIWLWIQITLHFLCKTTSLKSEKKFCIEIEFFWRMKIYLKIVPCWQNLVRYHHFGDKHLVLNLSLQIGYPISQIAFLWHVQKNWRN